jgi:epoxyqueuosine reductase
MTVDSQAIKQLARAQGFALCGICQAGPSDYAQQLREWLDAGKQGQMAWLARNVDLRLDPRKLVEGAKSVVVVADRLAHPLPPGEGGERSDPGEGATDHRTSRNRGYPLPALPRAGTAPVTGRVARYAQVSDYHKVMKKRLQAMCDAMRKRWAGESFRACVDTAPLLEREHAQRAGIGWVGKHTLMLNRELGSHVMLGAIVTTLAIEADEPATDHCGSCTRCIDACPTKAITPYSVDARRCISYLTIEHRGEIDVEYHEAMGQWVFGCDVCQEVCPYVQRAHASKGEMGGATAETGGYRRHPAELDVGQVLDWDEGTRRKALESSAMKRAKLEMMRRNGLIVAGNALRGGGGDGDLLSRIRRIADDPDEPQLVSRTAGQVLAELPQRAKQGQ